MSETQHLRIEPTPDGTCGVCKRELDGYYGGWAYPIKSHDGPWGEIVSNDWRA